MTMKMLVCSALLAAAAFASNKPVPPPVRAPLPPPPASTPPASPESKKDIPFSLVGKLVEASKEITDKASLPSLTGMTLKKQARRSSWYESAWKGIKKTCGKREKSGFNDQQKQNGEAIRCSACREWKKSGLTCLNVKDGCRLAAKPITVILIQPMTGRSIEYPNINPGRRINYLKRIHAEKVNVRADRITLVLAGKEVKGNPKLGSADSVKEYLQKNPGSAVPFQWKFINLSKPEAPRPVEMRLLKGMENGHAASPCQPLSSDTLYGGPTFYGGDALSNTMYGLESISEEKRPEVDTKKQHTFKDLSIGDMNPFQSTSSCTSKVATQLRKKDTISESTGAPDLPTSPVAMPAMQRQSTEDELANCPLPPGN